MGDLGFLFKLNKEKIVIFTLVKKLNSNIILGFEDYFSKENIKFLFLNSNLKLEKYYIFEDAKLRYGKIKINNEKLLDLNDFLFYFDPKKYKQLKELFETSINLENKIIIEKIILIYEIFTK